jgi:hypothetical protein
VIACVRSWLKNRQAIYRWAEMDFVCWKMRREYNQTSYGYDGRTSSADVIGRPG